MENRYDLKDAKERLVLGPFLIAKDRSQYEIVDILDKTIETCVIPDGITSIDSEAFRGCNSLTEVTIPDSVTDIWDLAFAECIGLKKITIGKGVREIHQDAFKNCTALKEVRISDLGAWCEISFFASDGTNPLSYAHDLYLSGELLTSPVIPDGVVHLYTHAFYKSSITGITIPDSVTSMGRCVFEGCDHLTEITIPAGVTDIEGTPFNRCNSLKSVTVQPGNPYYHSDGNCLIFDEIKTVIGGCPTSVIPSDGSVREIGSIAFAGLGNMTSVTIPDTVRYIGDFAFMDCTQLKTIVYTGTKAQWEKIVKHEYWDYRLPDYTVRCIDGELSKQQ